jgi:uncharacterized protein YbbK (DUF523 family)
MELSASASEGTAGSPAILVSACLLGVRCNHQGSASPTAAVVALGEAGYRLVPVCPEVAGGLPTPRAAAAVVDGVVVDSSGRDVTDFYRRGAAVAVALAQAVGASRAVLKARSPSCGCHQVYDSLGPDRRRVPGMGVTAAALVAAGFEVGDEEDEAGRALAAP